MTTMFREYAKQRDLQEVGFPTPGASPANLNPAAADPKVTQAVQQAKQALTTPDKMSDKVKRDLETAKDTLSKVKVDKDRVEVSKLVQELDPAIQGKPGMTPPTVPTMMKKRMKKK